MRTTRFLFLVLALGLGAAIVPAADRAQERRLQEAIHLMETKGDYPAAIKVFEELAKGPDRALAARALLYVGICYEKLGKAEAQKAYERVIREFADQSEVVPQARERLAALERAAGSAKRAETVVRRVWEDAIDTLGAPSSDGKYLSCVDWDTGDLAIRELATGKNRRLTSKGSWKDSSEFALYSIWSPDGQQVAYSWFNKENKYDLRTIQLDGSEPRVLHANEEVTYVQPADWSPDGKYILAIFSRKDRTNQIVLVSVADSSVRVLKSLDWRYPQKLCFSPDGRYLVYDFPPKEDSLKRDIFLLAADGSREIRLVEHPANDFVLGWAPDGKRVLFASDRRGSVDAWAISVTDGKPIGSPELVKLDIGHGFQPMGFTRRGSYYYGMVSGQGQNVFLAELDPLTGKVSGPPKSATERFAGENSRPAWSRDGRYLSFESIRPGRDKVLCILSLDTGEEREFPMKLKFQGNLGDQRWSPDGRSILVTSYSQKGQGIYKIDTQTGEVAPLLLGEDSVVAQRGLWSPDGKAIYYRHRDQEKGSSIHVRELETGVDRELYRAPTPLGAPTPHASLDLSADGRHLAFVSADRATHSTSLYVLPTAGGEPRELLRLKEPETIGTFPQSALAWTPDGRYLLFFKSRRGVNNQIEKTELWRIPEEGGESEKLLDLLTRQVHGLGVHPDGRRITFAGEVGQRKSEVWVMENFLPATPREAPPASP